MREGAFCLAPLLAALLLGGCQQRMGVEGHFRDDDPSPWFWDGALARPLVPGTVARESSPTRGDSDSEPARSSAKARLARGRGRFEIYCAPCHGELGDGRGMVVRRGFGAPPTFHQERLRRAPDRHFYDVITSGYGAMYAYSDRVPAEERWEIIAYVRALQLSQNARVGDLPPEDRAKLGDGR